MSDARDQGASTAPSGSADPTASSAPQPAGTASPVAATPRAPRPAYGEYASPEELREILGADHPLLRDATDAVTAPAPGAVPPAVATTPPGAAPGAPTPGYSAPYMTTPTSVPGAAEKAATKARPRWDLPITVGLLVFGAFNVVTTLTSRDLYPQRFEQVFQIMGLGEFTATGAAAAAANWDAGLQLAILVVTIAVVALVVRRLRVVFWIPLAGGALASIASMIVAVTVMLQDPAYLQMLQR